MEALFWHIFYWCLGGAIACAVVLVGGLIALHVQARKKK